MAPATPERPNLLVLMTDQHAAAAMSCAGCADLRTPHLDRLAARGVRFDRAYATFPLCGPFRACMLTGRYPHQLGAMRNGDALRDDDRLTSLGHALRAGGYATAYGGKWHVPSIALPADADARFGLEPICGFNDPALPGACIDWLRRDHDRPFLLFASFDNPHNICEHSRDQVLPWGDVPDGDPGGWPNLPANFAPPAYEPAAIDEVRRASAGGRYAYGPDRWRRYRHVYYRLVEKVDAQIGRILDALDETGLADTTAVVFLADHGDHAGAHALGQKSLPYEESARVPFIIAAPGGPRGVVSDALVNAGVDLLPTLLDLAGVDDPAPRSGVSARPLLDPGRHAGERDHLVIEAIADRTAIEYRCVVTQRHKYVLFNAGQHREALFDLVHDPGEMVNLAVERRHAPQLDEHRRRLYDWCLQTGDTFGAHYSHRPQPVIPGFGFRD